MTISPSDRAAFGIITVIAALVGALAIAEGAWRTIVLATGTGPVELFARGELPGAPFARITTATVTSGQLGGLSQGSLVAGSIVSLLTVAAVYTAIVFFMVMTTRGTPFHHYLYPVTLTAGIFMTIGGAVEAVLTGFGQMQGSIDLGVTPDGPFEAAFALAPGPWAFGFVVLVAAFVLRAGQRMQHDTEGLV